MLRHQRRHMGRKRLGRRQRLAFRAALRHGALLDRPHRLAGIAVEDEHEPLLGRLDHDVTHALAGFDTRQRRLRRQVVVPDVVMHGLERPGEFTGLALERDHGIGMRVVAGPLAAPEIRARRGRRQEHEPALVIGRHRRPDIGVASVDAVMDQRIEAPARRAAPCIEGAHRAERCFDANIVRYRRADHHDTVGHDGSRGDLEFAGPEQALADVDLHLAVAAETRAGHAGLRIERDQACVVGPHIDAAAAGGAIGCSAIDPMRDATAVEAVAGTLGVRDFRIEAPFLRAGAGIERYHLVERRTQDQTVLDEQRCRLELGALHRLRRAAGEIAGTVGPRRARGDRHWPA